MSYDQAPVRIVQVGCGDIARRGHLPALARSTQARLVGVVDVNRSAARRAAEIHDVPELADLPAAVSAGAGAVIIATPPHITPGLTAQATSLGLDVLCEKPMALSLDSAEAVRLTAEETGQIVQVGFKNRFSPLIVTLRRWLRADLIGSPLVFTIGLFDESRDPANDEHVERMLTTLSHGDAFTHDGAHFADYLNFLSAGRPQTVQAIGVKTSCDLPAENFVSVLVSLDNGDVARLEIGWLFATSPNGEFRVLGAKGVATVDRHHGVATLDTASGHEEVTLDQPWNDICFDRQLQHFIECVRTRRTPDTDVRAGLASLRLTTAAEQALRDRKVVRTR